MKNYSKRKIKFFKNFVNFLRYVTPNGSLPTSLYNYVIRFYLASKYLSYSIAHDSPPTIRVEKQIFFFFFVLRILRFWKRLIDRWFLAVRHIRLHRSRFFFSFAKKIIKIFPVFYCDLIVPQATFLCLTVRSKNEY